MYFLLDYLVQKKQVVCSAVWKIRWEKHGKMARAQERRGNERVRRAHRWYIQEKNTTLSENLRIFRN